MATTFGKSEPIPKKPKPSVFLPFITNKSSPETVFKTLVQRTKGVDYRDLLLIYIVILKFGIEKIRKCLPKNLSDTYTVINKVKENYLNHRPSLSALRYWENVLREFGFDKIKNKEKFSIEEITIMFTAIAIEKPEYLKEINFEVENFNVLEEFSFEDFDCKIEYLNSLNISIDKKYEVKYFSNKEQFKSFMAYQVAFKNVPSNFYPIHSQNQNDFKKDSNNNFTDFDDDIPF